MSCGSAHELEIIYLGTTHTPAAAFQRVVYLHVRGGLLFGCSGHFMFCVGEANEKCRHIFKRMFGWMYRGRISCTLRILGGINVLNFWLPNNTVCETRDANIKSVMYINALKPS